jgi:hypothetical protein
VNREAWHVELLRRIAAEKDPDARSVKCPEDPQTVLNVLFRLDRVELRVAQTVPQRLRPLLNGGTGM